MFASGRPEWRTRAVPALVAVVVVAAMAMVTGGASGAAATVVPSLLVGGTVATAVWAVFRWRADRRTYELRLTAWAASEAAVAERLRIARDLHDIVSHGLGLITVRSASVRHLAKPDEVDAALTDIEQASRSATAELRRMLTVLRDPTALSPGLGPARPDRLESARPDRLESARPAGLESARPAGLESARPDGSAAPVRPIDDLSALPGIVSAAGKAGVRPTLSVAGLGPVSPGVQLAVCQIVREALSNTARHAGPADVRITVHRDGGILVVTVADTGPAPGWRPAPGAGHGLLGLHERIAALGGRLTTHHTGRGFQLTAHIPDEVAAA